MIANKLTDIKDPISFAQAAKLYPTPVSPETVARHAIHGISGERLFSFMSGGRRRTTPAFVEEFLQRVNAARNAKITMTTPAEQVVSVATRGAQAKRALQGMGLATSTK